MHEIKCLVNVLKRQPVCDHRIYRDLSVHVPINNGWHVGPALRAAERSASPVPPGYELERPRGDFLACFGNADDDARTPATMTAFECRAHYIGVPGGVESIVCAAARNGDDFFDNSLA